MDETAPKWNLHYTGVSNPDLYIWREHNSTFDGMAFFDNSSFNLSDNGTAQRVDGAHVTYDLLNVLGLKPALGRAFRPEEDRPKSLSCGDARLRSLAADVPRGPKSFRPGLEAG